MIHRLINSDLVRIREGQLADLAVGGMTCRHRQTLLKVITE